MATRALTRLRSPADPGPVRRVLTRPIELGPLQRALTQPIEYDAVRRRLWIMGQRCHHGATGAVLTAAGVAGLAAGRQRGCAALAWAGSLMMVHDWKDRGMWFQPGHGSQP